MLALASTAIPFSTSVQDEAERWLRVLRLHGQVGAALQSLGVPEGPLETEADRPVHRRGERRIDGGDPVEGILARSRSLAARRGASHTGTLDVLFALLAVYGRAFDRALYTRGTSRDELIGCLARRTAAGASKS